MRFKRGVPRSFARPAMHAIAILIITSMVLVMSGAQSAFATYGTTTATSTKTATSTPTPDCNQSNKNNPPNCPSPTAVCGNGQHVGNPHCNTATPTPTATKTATPTVTSTSTPTATATPECSQSNKNNPPNCPSPTPVCGYGQHVGNPHCNTATPTATPKGSIRIEKITLDSHGHAISKGTFTFSIDGSAKSPAVAGGSGQTYGNIATGAHTVTEQPQAGWKNLGGTILTGDAKSCFDTIKDDDEDDDDYGHGDYKSSSFTVNNPSLQVNVQANKTVTVCWTNKQERTEPTTGSIRIEKLAFDKNGAPISAGSFTFAVDGTAKAPAIAGGTGRTYGDIATGAHTVTEQAQSGWTNLGGFVLPGYAKSCFDLAKGNNEIKTDNENIQNGLISISTSVPVTVEAGKTVVVCWGNQQTDTPPAGKGSIRVEKITYNASGSMVASGSFTFLVDGAAQTPAVAGLGSQTFGNFAVGAHTVTEQAQSGWTSLGGATLNNLEANSCRSAFEGMPDGEFLSQSVNASVSNDTTTVVCWYNRQTTTPTPTPTPPPSGCVDCDSGVSETTSTPTPPAAPQVAASTAQITKVLSSANPARVGERVTFTVNLTVTGDAPVTGVSLVDTYENAYLRFVGSAPAGCVSAAGVPDAAHSQVMCALPDMTPGTTGSAGTKTAIYMLTFEALAPTSRTVDSVVAKADLDGSGPAAPTTIGPASDGVAIIGLPTALPKAGDGELIDAMSVTETVRQWTLISVLFGFVGAAAVALRGSRLWQ